MAGAMTPVEFQRKWTGHSLTERSSYQQHFLDIRELLGQEKPAVVDKTGESFTFEKRVQVLGGGKGAA